MVLLDNFFCLFDLIEAEVLDFRLNKKVKDGEGKDGDEENRERN